MERSGRVKKSGEAPSALIDKHLAQVGGWRGDVLGRIRSLIKDAVPSVVEEWKWGIPVWSCDGIICTGETYKAKVKLTFAKGAFVKDPSRLFNSSLEGSTRRAIDIGEGATVDAAAFKALIRAAVAVNSAGGKAASKKHRTAGRKSGDRVRCV